VQYAEHPVGTSIREGGVSHVQSGDLRRERQHVSRVDPVHNLRNPLRRYHPAGMTVQATLRGLDLPEHAVIGKGGVAGAMLGHEPEWARILHSTELGAAVSQQPAPCRIRDPFAEVV